MLCGSTQTHPSVTAHHRQSITHVLPAVLRYCDYHSSNTEHTETAGDGPVIVGHLAKTGVSVN